MWAEYHASRAPVDTPVEPEIVHSDVHFQEPVHFEAVHSTVEEEHPKVDISEVDTVDKVDAEEAVHSSKDDARREYEREYKRRKRAEARRSRAPMFTFPRLFTRPLFTARRRKGTFRSLFTPLKL